MIHKYVGNTGLSAVLSAWPSVLLGFFMMAFEEEMSLMVKLLSSQTAAVNPRERISKVMTAADALLDELEDFIRTSTTETVMGK